MTERLLLVPEEGDGARREGSLHDRARLECHGKLPVCPPTEDVYVGDVYAFPEPPRWKSLAVLSDLGDERRLRPCVSRFRQ